MGFFYLSAEYFCSWFFVVSMILKESYILKLYCSWQCFNMHNLVIIRASNVHEKMIRSFLFTHYWPREPSITALWMSPCSKYVDILNDKFASFGECYYFTPFLSGLQYYTSLRHSIGGLGIFYSVLILMFLLQKISLV